MYAKCNQTRIFRASPKTNPNDLIENCKILQIKGIVISIQGINLVYSLRNYLPL